MEALYTEQFLKDYNGVLSDICDYTKERIDVELLNEETYYSTENMLPNKAGATVASGLPATGKTPACFPGNVLISNIRPYFKKIVYCHEESGCSADVLCFVAKNSLLAPYIFATLYVDKFFDYMVAGSKGTKMPRGDKRQIMQYPVHIPTEEELKVFSSTASNILEMIRLNTIENKRLESIRNSLLPKLMSGELDVSELDI